MKSYFLEKVEKAAKPGKFGKKTGRHSYGAMFDAVLTIDNPTDAKKFFDGYVEWLSEQDELTDDPAYVAKHNIGYMFGYYSEPEKYEMWMKATGVKHPIFGKDLHNISPEEAFWTGQKSADDGK